MTSRISLTTSWIQIATGASIVSVEGEAEIAIQAAAPAAGFAGHRLSSEDDPLDYAGALAVWARGVSPSSVAIVSGANVQPSVAPVAAVAPAVTTPPSMAPANPTAGGTVTISLGAASGVPAPKILDAQLVVGGERVAIDSPPVKMPRAGAWSLNVVWGNGVAPNAVGSASGTVAAPAGASAPAQMAAPTLTGGTGQATVAFAAAPADGGSPITGYGYQITLASDPTFAAPVAVGSQATRVNVTATGLAAGSYISRTRAVNAVGNGAWSAASAAATVAAGGFALWAGAVNPDGFIYTAAAPIGAAPNPATDAIVMQSPGFDASGAPTTRTRTIPFLGYGRQFYPNGGTAITTQAILAQRVFSGEVPPGVASNGSAKTDRAPFIGFLTPAHRWLTAASLTMDVFVDHWHAMDGKPVAAVRGAVKDSAGAVFYSPWVSAEVARPSVVSGITVPVYRCTVDFTGAAAGLLWSYVQVAPNIGTAIYDQIVAEPTDEVVAGNRPQRHYYDPADTLRRYVTLGGADDTPKGVGTTPGTAPAYLTVNGAAAALDVAMTDLGLGGVILLPDGVTANMAPGLNSRATNAFGIQIEGVGPLFNGVITTGADSSDYVFEKAIWSRLSIDGTGAGRVFANRATSAQDHFQTFWRVNLVNCPVAATDYFQNCGRCYFHECVSDSPDGFTSDVQGNVVNLAAYQSVKIGGNSTSHAIGCKINADFQPGTGAFARAPICAYNLMHAAGGANNVKLDGFLAGQDGFCVVGNVMAHTGATNDDNMELEGSAPEEFYNAILAHNTCVGGGSNGSRSNQSNEEGDFSLCHEMKVVACIFDGRVKQGDYDNLGAAATQGSRRRNHPVRWGVDEAHNVTHRIAAPAVFGFNQNDGERASLYSIDPTTRLSFADDRTALGTNTATIDAPGDYRLLAASLPGNIPRPVGASIHHAFDLQGTPIPTNGTALPGALQTTA